MLILCTLRYDSRHGQGIIHTIRLRSRESLLINHGSLYPALQRLQRRGWVRAQWGTSENNRRAKFYSITESGRRKLDSESTKWDRLCEAIARVMEPEAET